MTELSKSNVKEYIPLKSEVQFNSDTKFDPFADISENLQKSLNKLGEFRKDKRQFLDKKNTGNLNSNYKNSEMLFESLKNNPLNNLSGFKDREKYIILHSKTNELKNELDLLKKLDKQVAKGRYNSLSSLLSELQFQQKFAEQRNGSLLSSLQKSNFKQFDRSYKSQISLEKLRKQKENFRKFLAGQAEVIKAEFWENLIKKGDFLRAEREIEGKLRENLREIEGIEKVMEESNLENKKRNRDNNKTIESEDVIVEKIS